MATFLNSNTEEQPFFSSYLSAAGSCNCILLFPYLNAEDGYIYFSSCFFVTYFLLPICTDLFFLPFFRITPSYSLVTDDAGGVYRRQHSHGSPARGPGRHRLQHGQLLRRQEGPALQHRQVPSAGRRQWCVVSGLHSYFFRITLDRAKDLSVFYAHFMR